MLQVSDLYFEYEEAPVLENVAFRVPNATLLHLQGVNGSGKTTLLKLLAGILMPSGGAITFNGNSIADDLPSYQQHLHYIGHKPGINLALTPRENAYFDVRGGEGVNASWPHWLEQLSLSGLDDTACVYLSAGQRRRVGLLRLLYAKARLWLLDEPLVALDQQGIHCLKHYMDEHLMKGGSIVMTSHQALPFHQGDYLEYCL